MVSPLRNACRCLPDSFLRIFLCASVSWFLSLTLILLSAENPEEATHQQLGLISEFNLARLPDIWWIWKKVYFCMLATHKQTSNWKIALRSQFSKRRANPHPSETTEHCWEKLVTALANGRDVSLLFRCQFFPDGSQSQHNSNQNSKRNFGGHCQPVSKCRKAKQDRWN